MRLMFLLLAIALAGCAEVWVRPGTSEADAEAMNTQCTRAARVAIPPVLDQRLVRPPRWVWVEHCHGGRCRLVPVREGPVFETVDLNAPARDQWRRDCMEERGFIYQGLRPLRLSGAASPD